MPKVGSPGFVRLGLPFARATLRLAAGYLLETPLYPALLVHSAPYLEVWSVQ
jgi:hypothetical protein